MKQSVSALDQVVVVAYGTQKQVNLTGAISTVDSKSLDSRPATNVASLLQGQMAGVTVSGVLWAIFQNNAGGAWDNAKKSFEAGVMIDGKMTYKGSEAHKAAVTGDTVGDPFKDTSGPSMNILIKLTCLIGLVIAPILGGHTVDADNREVNAIVTTTEQVENTGDAVEKEVVIESLKDAAGNVKSTVTTTTEEGVTVKVFEGTEADVRAQVEAYKRQ